jgi:hypothetical protein
MMVSRCTSPATASNFFPARDDLHPI